MGKNRRRTLYRALNRERKRLSSNDYCYMISQIKFSGIKQQPFYYAHRFCGSETWKEQNRDGLSLLQHIGGFVWEELKAGGDSVAGVWNHPQAFSVTSCWCWLLAGIPAGAVNPSTSTTPATGPGFPYGVAASRGSDSLTWQLRASKPGSMQTRQEQQCLFWSSRRNRTMSFLVHSMGIESQPFKVRPHSLLSIF